MIALRHSPDVGNADIICVCTAALILKTGSVWTSPGSKWSASIRPIPASTTSGLRTAAPANACGRSNSSDGRLLDTIELHPDFKEFLKLLNAKKVEYLLIGGYAVNLHGYPRFTQDIDIWVAMKPENARRIVDALREFGFGVPALSEQMFQAPRQIIRMGITPVCIELTTTISGVEFDECSERALTKEIDGIPVPLISLADLRKNKQASGRGKDIVDLEHLPEE